MERSEERCGQIGCEHSKSGCPNGHERGIDGLGAQILGNLFAIRGESQIDQHQANHSSFS